MAFSITAVLPLGTYRGAGPDGRVERIPSVARLHAALLCAAGFGPRAQPHPDGLGLGDVEAAALRWLEQNPPDGVSIPALQVNRGTAVAYRDDGTLKKSKAVLSVKRLPKNPDVSVAVNGRFTWTWSQVPPPEVAAVLEALCPDVAYLGTSESPVRLTTSADDASPTHILDEQAGLFGSAGVDVDLPLPGRLAELTAAHRAATGRPPSPARDGYRTDERSSSPVPPRNSVALARYTPREAPPADVPWPQVVTVPIDRPVQERDRVRWAVAVHRALISTIRHGAPPLLTGTYPPGIRRPTNRIALHFLDQTCPVDLPDGAPAALAALVPAGAEPGDVQAVLNALAGLPSFRGPRGDLRRMTGPLQLATGAQFWRERPAGTVRLWRTSPPAVPDTRGVGDNWTFGHAALLSLGFVWQGTGRLPKPAGRGEARYRELAASVSQTGAVAVTAAPVRTTSVHDYVHRVNEHAVVRPYRAGLWLGSLGGDQVVQAIGQTRHLGGGLLVPVDVPEGAALDDAVLLGDRAPGRTR